MPRAREPCAPKTRHRVRIVRVLQAFDQPHRINQERADDRRIKALVVEHQHRFVEARLRVHDKPAGAGLRRIGTEVRCDKPLAVHQRHIQVRERRHRAAAAIRRQTGDAGALKQKCQQFSLGEDPRDQFTVLEVVLGQRRFVLGEHAIDLVHALVRIVDGLAFTEQGLGDVFQAERGEAPRRRTQGFDAIDDQPPRRRGEVMIAAAVLTPLHLFIATAEFQRYAEAPRVFVEDAQIELHDVPADDRVRVVQREPIVELLQDDRA